MFCRLTITELSCEIFFLKLQYQKPSWVTLRFCHDKRLPSWLISLLPDSLALKFLLSLIEKHQVYAVKQNKNKRKQKGKSWANNAQQIAETIELVWFLVDQLIGPSTGDVPSSWTNADKQDYFFSEERRRQFRILRWWKRVISFVSSRLTPWARKKNHRR